MRMALEMGVTTVRIRMVTVLVTLATTIVYNFVVGFIRTCARSIAEPKLDDALNGVEQKLLAKGFPEKLTRDLKTFSRNYILGLKE